MDRQPPSIRETIGFLQTVYHRKYDRSGFPMWHHPVWVMMRAARNAPDWFKNGLLLHDVIEDTHRTSAPVTPATLFAMGYDPRTVWMAFHMSRLDKEVPYRDYIHAVVNGDFGVIDGKAIPDQIREEVTHGSIIGKYYDNCENRSEFRMERLPAAEALKLEAKWREPGQLLRERVEQLPEAVQMMMGREPDYHREPMLSRLSDAELDGNPIVIEPHHLVPQNLAHHARQVYMGPRQRSRSDEPDYQLGCDPRPSQAR